MYEKFKQYKESPIYSMSNLELLLLLYDEAVKRLKMAQIALEDKKYETFLELLQEEKVNRDYSGCEILDSREYTCKLKEAICGEDGRESKYEYRIASTKFLPGNDRGFYNLFYEAFEYGQAHFLKAVF